MMTAMSPLYMRTATNFSSSLLFALVTWTAAIISEGRENVELDPIFFWTLVLLKSLALWID